LLLPTLLPWLLRNDDDDSDLASADDEEMGDEGTEEEGAALLTPYPDDRTSTYDPFFFLVAGALKPKRLVVPFTRGAGILEAVFAAEEEAAAEEDCLVVVFAAAMVGRGSCNGGGGGSVVAAIVNLGDDGKVFSQLLLLLKLDDETRSLPTEEGVLLRNVVCVVSLLIEIGVLGAGFLEDEPEFVMSPRETRGGLGDDNAAVDMIASVIILYSMEANA
jgi:hypothetical protein